MSPCTRTFREAHSSQQRMAAASAPTQATPAWRRRIHAGDSRSAEAMPRPSSRATAGQALKL